MEVCADSVGQFLGAEQSVGLGHLALGVNPARLYRAEPGTLDRQVTDDDPHALAFPLDPAVVLAKPSAHFSTYMPRSIIPSQQERLLPQGLKTLTDPFQKLGGHPTYRA